MRKRKKTFDVEFVPPKLRVVRVLAEDEFDAGEIAVGLFETGTTVRQPDGRRRVVYESRRFKGTVPVRRNDRRAK